MSIFSAKVKSMRKGMGWTQDELARRVGVSRSCVGNWEQGLREPDFETTEALADVFNCDIDYLVGKKSDNNLSVDEMYVIECMRADTNTKERLISYAKFLLNGGEI